MGLIDGVISVLGDLSMYTAMMRVYHAQEVACCRDVVSHIHCCCCCCHVVVYSKESINNLLLVHVCVCVWHRELRLM